MQNTEAIKKSKSKYVPTKDDIIIEYLERIIEILDKILLACHSRGLKAKRVDNVIPADIKVTLESFSRLKTWSFKLQKFKQVDSLVPRLNLTL